MTIYTYSKQFPVERAPMNSTTTSPLEDDSHRKLTLNLSRNQDCASNRGANHINFSVAALLADTRNHHRKTPSPLPEQQLASSEDDIPDNDEDLDMESGEDDENIDVEAVKRAGSPGDSTTPPPHSLNSFLQHPANSLMAARFMLGAQPVPPVRPTPFSAFAAAAAASFAGLQHSSSWSHGPYNPASSVFPSFTDSLSNSPGKNFF